MSNWHYIRICGDNDAARQPELMLTKTHDARQPICHHWAKWVSDLDLCLAQPHQCWWFATGMIFGQMVVLHTSTVQSNLLWHVINQSIFYSWLIHHANGTSSSWFQPQHDLHYCTWLMQDFVLTHWSLGDVVILKESFSNPLYRNSLGIYGESVLKWMLKSLELLTNQHWLRLWLDTDLCCHMASLGHSKLPAWTAGI